jgi:elongation factor 1-beta
MQRAFNFLRLPEVRFCRAVGAALGDVAVVFRILPEDVDVNLGELEQRIRESVSKECEINRITVEEVAFGLKSLRLETILKDEEGKIGSVEDIMRGIPGISQIDTEDVTLV